MITIRCTTCKKEFNGIDEYHAEVKFNNHECTVDYSKLSDEELLQRIREEQNDES